MTVFLIILGALVAVGVVLFLTHKPDPMPEERATDATQEPTPDEEEEVCCGLHEVCERFAPAPDKPVYFDDEELDRFAGRDAQAYTPDETDEFREVMLTLIASDVAPWGASLKQRGIELPAELRDEYIILLNGPS